MSTVHPMGRSERERREAYARRVDGLPYPPSPMPLGLYQWPGHTARASGRTQGDQLQAALAYLRGRYPAEPLRIPLENRVRRRWLYTARMRVVRWLRGRR